MLSTPAFMIFADDEERYRKANVDVLQFLGYNVEGANCGEEFRAKANQVLQEGIPFIFIVDNQMPERIGEPERQWCGFEHVARLCKEFPNRLVSQRVLFLSRWSLDDLPNELQREAKSLSENLTTRPR